MGDIDPSSESHCITDNRPSWRDLNKFETALKEPGSSSSRLKSISRLLFLKAGLKKSQEDGRI